LSVCLPPASYLPACLPVCLFLFCLSPLSACLFVCLSACCLSDGLSSCGGTGTITNVCLGTCSASAPKLPTCSAGSSFRACYSSVFAAGAQLKATYGGSATGGQWSGFGSGSVSSVTNKAAVFYPSSSQVLMSLIVLPKLLNQLSQEGTLVTLTWTSTGQPAPCSACVSTVTISIDAPSSCTISPATVICLNASATVTATTTNAQGGTWLGYGAGSVNTTTASPLLFTPATSQASSTVALQWIATPLTGSVCPAATCLCNVGVVGPSCAACLSAGQAGSAQSVCVGGNITLGASLGNLATGTWTNFAPGTLSNASSPSAIFTPDLTQANSVVNLVWTLTAQPLNACNAFETCTAGCFLPISVSGISAGGSQTICGNTVARLQGTVNGISLAGVSWTVSAGTVSPANSPVGNFAPASSQYGKSVTLTMSATTSPCNTAVSSNVEVSVVNPPKVNWGATAMSFRAPERDSCELRAILMVAISPLPLVFFKVTAACAITTICETGSTALTSTLTGGDQAGGV
jgi:hypothetical protein